MNNKFFTARNVALLGILIALAVVLQIFASGISIFGITMNFSLIPIALAGIMMGWIGGGIIGLVCGLVVFITAAVMGQEPSTAFFFQVNPGILSVMCIGKTTIAGIVCGLLYKLISKENEIIAVCVSAIVIPIINTGIYMIGIVLMKDAASQFLGLTQSSAGVVFVAVFGLIWINFLIEMAINIVFVPIINRVMKVLNRK